MKNILLYICDPDEIYLDRLNSYIQHREYSPFIVRTYTGLESMEKEDEEPGVLLANLIYFADIQKGRGSSLAIQERTPVIYLNEGRGIDVAKIPGNTKNPVDILDKYQSARKIYDHILDVCAAQGEFLIHPESLRNTQVKLIGVYSPENKRIQRSFAWSLAQKLGSSSHGLYLSLEEFFSGSNSSKGLSELILAIKECVKHKDFLNREPLAVAESSGTFGLGSAVKSKPAASLEDYVQKDGDLDIIPPVLCPYDLKEIGEEEWYYWLEQVIRQSGYSFIIINFGNEVPGLCLLELCSEIYVPWTPEDEEVCRHFKDTLEFMGKHLIADKIQFVSMGGTCDGLL